MRKAEKHCLNFAKKYADEWHGFSQDAETKTVIRNLEIKQYIVVDWNTNQFKYNKQ